MKDFCKIYQLQYKKAKEILVILKEQRNQIDLNLLSNPSCSILNKELRAVNLNIRITENEIEHAESAIIKYVPQNIVETEIV